MKQEKTGFSASRRIVESAVLLAMGTVLSLVRLIDLPFGGEVTPASMLPVILIAYRYGTKWGILSGIASGVIRQLLGLNTLSFVSTAISIIAVILLDYVAAFAVTGLGGVFRRAKSQPVSIVCGTLLACVLRYVFHVISGATVWAGLSIPTGAALVYSIGYNATYMIPETIITVAVGYYIGSVLDFRKDAIIPLIKDKREKISVGLLIGRLLVIGAVIADTLLIFSKLQNPETGNLDLTLISQVSWKAAAIVTCSALAAAVIFYEAAVHSMKKKTE